MDDLQGKPRLGRQMCQVLGCTAEADFRDPAMTSATGTPIPDGLYLCSKHYMGLVHRQVPSGLPTPPGRAA